MREFGWKQALAWIAVAVVMILLGGCGFVALSVGTHLYQDHVLIDNARAQDAQRLLQAAEQVQKFQQSQQAPQAPPAAPAPAAPAAPEKK